MRANKAIIICAYNNIYYGSYITIYTTTDGDTDIPISLPLNSQPKQKSTIILIFYVDFMKNFTPYDFMEQEKY